MIEAVIATASSSDRAACEECAPMVVDLAPALSAANDKTAVGIHVLCTAAAAEKLWEQRIHRDRYAVVTAERDHGSLGQGPYVVIAAISEISVDDQFPIGDVEYPIFRHARTGV